jgi:hypothetical protein
MLPGEDGALFAPGRLRSQWEMLRDDAAQFMILGQALYDATAIYGSDKWHPFDPKKQKRQLNAEGEEGILDAMTRVKESAYRLNLPVSLAVIEKQIRDRPSLPQTVEEYDKIIDIFREELATKLFLFVPAHLSKYYECDNIVGEKVISAFPNASNELREAGTAIATGQYTASVFHSMRAAEIGLRAMNSAFPLTIKGNKPLELADWREILDALSNVARDIENRPNGDATKEPDQNFLSEAAAQFRFFKNGWRVRVAHARATYKENQAVDALEHVRSFFEILANRLHE